MRLAIPRRVYTQSHVDYTVEVVEEVFRRRQRMNTYQRRRLPLGVIYTTGA